MKKFIILFSAVLIFLLTSCQSDYTGMIMTVDGPISPEEMGMTLSHEHILVDFIGADSISHDRWNKAEVVEKATPYLVEAAKTGVVTLMECTPSYLGRDPELMRSVSSKTGIHILTNTGYYGAAGNKYIPNHAYHESADELASRWIAEWEKGIDKTSVRPGFIKIGVMPGDLSELHRKLARAAAKTHLETGLVIASHTGLAEPAFGQLGVLMEEGVSPEAFIWVHAQSEKDSSAHIMAARTGAWVSFDGVSKDNTAEYVRFLRTMKDNDLLDKVLLSHDAGWYQPGVPNGGEYRGYTDIFQALIPALKSEGFSQEDIDLMLVKNPAEAFTIRVRRDYL